MELKNCINDVFKDYCEDYKCLLYDFRPWAEEHSIHETNQVSNFISTYRKKREKSIACLEFSIPYNNAEGVKKRDSVDGLIVDADTIIFIEAKRFSRGKKIRDLEEDLKRIKVLAEDEVCRKKKLKTGFLKKMHHTIVSACCWQIFGLIITAVYSVSIKKKII